MGRAVRPVIAYGTVLESVEDSTAQTRFERHDSVERAREKVHSFTSHIRISNDKKAKGRVASSGAGVASVRHYAS